MHDDAQQYAHADGSSDDSDAPHADVFEVVKPGRYA
jgi:hypothetical protein